MKRLLILLLTLIGTIHSERTGGGGIEGNAQYCNNEGGRVYPKSISNIHCFSCMCKNGQVECSKNKCPSEEGCYMLQNEFADADGCCRKCKGCNYHGVFHESGTEWTDENDACTVMTCKAGVVTESVMQCYTPCHSPIPPKKGECCASCPGCRINGQHFSSNRNVSLLDDPCLKCYCDNGRMTCSKKACPVLQCLPGNIEWRPGDCCPRCNGTRKLASPPKSSCLLGLEVLPAGKTARQDRCTYCACTNSTSVCKRETCAPVSCPLEKQTFPNHSTCCPQCPSYYENKTVCAVGDRVYQDGETWQANECKSCICQRGQIRCAMEICSQLSNALCPPNMKLHKDPGTCCPRCVESDGVCTVFGDPHYRTFDGKYYSFQGSCKYQLTADCVDKNFSIRVTNDARSTKTSAWTRTVSVKLGKMKVNLGDKMRVKVNGERVVIPYRRENQLSVTRNGDTVLLETYLGLKVLWDGNSFLEVSVPTVYKGRLCGLCGNYNSAEKDDFTTRDGRVVFNPDTFARSWQVGGKKACSRPNVKHRSTPCNNNLTSHRRVRDKMCKRLRSDLFSACHEKLDLDFYYKSCLTDMCECPGKKCYCESFTAYAHECQRLGILIPDWKAQMGCAFHNYKQLF